MSKASNKIVLGLKEAVAVAAGKKKPARTWTALDQKKHGVGGIIRGKLRTKKQDRRAQSGDLYAVVFFPQIHGIGNAYVGQHNMATLSQSPEAAKIKFMDRIKQGQKWADYSRAGWRIRKIKIADLGDARPSTPSKGTM